MKRIFMYLLLLGSSKAIYAQTVNKTDSVKTLEELEVRAVRVNDKAPFTKTNLKEADIKKLNQGQDIPFLLNFTPSVIVNSDAGNGVGYTGIRIRGTDATRINVTLNGIPYNDAESQGTFFVDLPDFASSVNSIQVQRGVGTSTNGSGAFGATISLSTNQNNLAPYTEFNNSYGSFNTWKNTIKAGTGLINNRFTADVRLSRISSDGYIDRAKSNLQSFYLSTAWLGSKDNIRFNIFSGKEKTYQAWNGVPGWELENNRTYNSSGTDKPGAPYDNEVDDYTQTHYQLFYNRQLAGNWKLSAATFLSRGYGFYENYKGQEKFSKYGLNDIKLSDTVIKRTDLIRQKWLDNYYYGQLLSLHYEKGKNEITVGGGFTRYDGAHYGEIIWAQYGIDKNYRYYDNDAFKTDFNVFTKWQHAINNYLFTFIDVQLKKVRHQMDGFADNPTLFVDRKFNFFNPRLGMSYVKNGWLTYASFALAGKEPNRNDFESDNNKETRAERLANWEAGIEKSVNGLKTGINFYLMQYKNQLVPTGKVNDVGAYTRMNVPKSYRAGVELQAAYTATNWIQVAANFTLSTNKIKSYTQYFDNYDADWNPLDQISQTYKNTTIAFSPATTGSAVISLFPFKDFECSFLSKQAGKQYLDNTEDENKVLNSYFTEDIRLIYTKKLKTIKEVQLMLNVNNIFNKKYEPNGYTYSYYLDATLTNDNYFMPMASTNFMLSINFKL